MKLQREALEYHSQTPPGKLEIIPTKPCLTQHDLALAYTPGVAAPCVAIAQRSEDAYRYTAKGNLVGIITNGTAVLGLGNIGALAGKPVMEGKAVLFKRFAGIDAIDLEVDLEDPELFIQTVQSLAPTFGGINLEDIKAPECFYIEERLQAALQIPVFHDDQHGTAIISGAALLNALELVNKRISEVKIVFAGAGAAAIATARFYVLLGANKENIVMCDRQGVIYEGRKRAMNPYKQEFAARTGTRTLVDAMSGADVFVGVSSAGLVSEEMLKRMAPRPVIFALANPQPEIGYDEAKAARPDAIVATGRSDYPNQVNNVLCFPAMFRGALDARATQVNPAMKLEAAKALAALAHESVPDEVAKAYGLESLRFGPDYLIPKPLDPRVLLRVAPAVAQAAFNSGAAKQPFEQQKYTEQLEVRQARSPEVMRTVFSMAKADPRCIVLAEGEHDKMIRAAHQLAEEGLARPLLLGSQKNIGQRARSLGLSLDGVEVIDPQTSELRTRYALRLYMLRHRKGLTQAEARKLITEPGYFASVMVEQAHADGMVCGLGSQYPQALRPPLQVLGAAPGSELVAGVYIITTPERVLFFADAAVNLHTDAPTLAQIAILTAHFSVHLGIKPRIALLSFSNFGNISHPRTDMVRSAVDLVRLQAPELAVDGEMRADTALSAEVLEGTYPLNQLHDQANVLIFPNLEAGNIACNLVQQMTNADVVGPILVGMARPAHVLPEGATVKDIVGLAAVAAVQAQKAGALAKASGLTRS